MVGTLEEELIRVVRTLEELQHKYLEQLEDESTTEDPGETLNDYEVLSEKMLDWIRECDNITRQIVLVYTSLSFIAVIKTKIGVPSHYAPPKLATISRYIECY